MVSQMYQLISVTYLIKITQINGRNKLNTAVKLKKMSNFWRSLQYVKLYDKDKIKGKFQSFGNFTKKLNDNDFLGFTFYKKPL